jgi:hypothetical protein
MKQTARNNAFLADVKKLMNRKIFRKVSEILNAYGQDEAQEYLAQFFGAENRAVLEPLEEEESESDE